MVTKREVWEHAKQTGLDDFIQAVSHAFPDAIEQVIIVSPGKKSRYDKNEARRHSDERAD